VSSIAPAPDRISGAGLAYAVSAYVLWGILPLAFLLLVPSSAVEIVSWRIVFSLVFCALLLTATRGWARFLGIARDRAAVGWLSLAAAFILVNWSVFIFATVTGHVVEAALGYFTNPIVTVLLGVIVLRERLRPLQWLAVGISAVAVLVLAIGYGSFPWIALSLAFSFGLYGFVKKKVGPQADAIGGLTMETLVLSPLAAIALVIVGFTSGLTIGTQEPLHTAVMLSVGAITAIPLLLFAAAARRLPLVYLGLVQYVAPIMQFTIGVWLLHEAMPPERWVGFGIVWLALAILTIDMFLRKPSSQALASNGT
jgi:chloramphenicol-sensitive protein RarD